MKIFWRIVWIVIFLLASLIYGPVMVLLVLLSYYYLFKTSEGKGINIRFDRWLADGAKLADETDEKEEEEWKDCAEKAKAKLDRWIANPKEPNMSLEDLVVLSSQDFDKYWDLKMKGRY